MTLLLAMDERQKSGGAIQVHKNSEVGKKCQHNREKMWLPWAGETEGHTNGAQVTLAAVTLHISNQNGRHVIDTYLWKPTGSARQTAAVGDNDMPMQAQRL